MKTQNEQPKRRVRYSAQQKRDALVLAAQEKSTQRAARLSGIPATTLYDWQKGRGVSNAVVISVGEKTAELACKYERITEECLNRITPNKLGAATPRDLMWCAGVATDKMLLLRGQPTTIVHQTESDSNVIESAARLMLESLAGSSIAITIEECRERATRQLTMKSDS